MMLVLRYDAGTLAGLSLWGGRCGRDTSPDSGLNGAYCFGKGFSGRGVGPINESDDEASGLDGRVYSCSCLIGAVLPSRVGLGLNFRWGTVLLFSGRSGP